MSTPKIGGRIVRHFCGGSWKGEIVKVNAKSIRVRKDGTNELITIRLDSLGLVLVAK